MSILFVDENDREWLGVFGRGKIVDFDEALSFPLGSSAIVISGGRGYILDVNISELTYRTKCNLISGVTAVPKRDLLIGYDFSKLYAYSSEEEVWESDRIALDGIKVTRASSELVKGRIWNLDGWHLFSLNLDDWSVEVAPEVLEIE